MNKYKALLIALLLTTGYSLLFLIKFGWIVAIVTTVFALAIGFMPIGGSFQKSISDFFWHIIMLRKREKEQDLNLENYGKKVAVGLSGGVDSAVTALLLKEQGYEVTAFFMQNWDRKRNSEKNNFLTEDELCSIEEDYKDAKSVANHLGIELIRVDFVKEYWNYVFSPFLKDIENGVTPNPDILCNRYIKFGAFLDYVFKNYPEMEFVAMGHYAKTIKKNGKWYLSQVEDKIKDQTYFLAEVKKEMLPKIKFPLGDFKKEVVREIAIKANLSVAYKKDSIGICFIGQRNFQKFISNYLEKTPGEIIKKETGEVVGKHIGVSFYTIGQRKGLNLGGQQLPHYVSSKDVKKNILYVSSNDVKDSLFSTNIKAKKFNDLSDDITKITGDIIIKTRHSEVTYPGEIIRVSKDKNEISIEIESYEPIKFVTSGQELVLYQDNIVLGGGVITNE